MQNKIVIGNAMLIVASATKRKLLWVLEHGLMAEEAVMPCWLKSRRVIPIPPIPVCFIPYPFPHTAYLHPQLPTLISLNLQPVPNLFLQNAIPYPTLFLQKLPMLWQFNITIYDYAVIHYQKPLCSLVCKACSLPSHNRSNSTSESQDSNWYTSSGHLHLLVSWVCGSFLANVYKYLIVQTEIWIRIFKPKFLLCCLISCLIVSEKQ